MSRFPRFRKNRLRRARRTVGRGAAARFTPALWDARMSRTVGQSRLDGEDGGGVVSCGLDPLPDRADVSNGTSQSARGGGVPNC